MKYVLIFCLWLLACNNAPTPAEEKAPAPADRENGATEAVTKTDTSLFTTSREVLLALKNKAFIKLAGFFHPELGVRFSPYGFVDTARHKRFYANDFVQAIANGNKYYWGAYDGTGDSILLSVAAYYKKFIYNADFLNAAKTSMNQRLGNGNSPDNIRVAYPGCNYVESYFPGFDKKYGGLDWTALRLVFKNYMGKNYLVAIIHDQWTT